MEAMKINREMLPPKMQMRFGAFEALSLREIEENKTSTQNKTIGNLTGYDCPHCLNRGYFIFLNEDGYRISRPCQCVEIRHSLQLIAKSGLSSLLTRYTFDAWVSNNTWQEKALQAAQLFAKKPNGNWFMMSGRPGTGKTHLCTAICGSLLKQGTPVQYLLWRDFSVHAKAVVNDFDAYNRIVGPLKSVPVLYIDDLFKAGKDAGGNKKITSADVNLAFEILNTRYNDERLVTILSSECSAGELINIDEGVGSRIWERSKRFYCSFGEADNWRMQ